MTSLFVNVGKNLADKIQSVTSKPSSFHENLSCVKHSFFFSPASPDEIETIIRSLKTKNLIEKMILKQNF